MPKPHRILKNIALWAASVRPVESKSISFLIANKQKKTMQTKINIYTKEK